MEKEAFKEVRKKAFDAGEGDVIAETSLVDGARLWIDDVVTGELTDEQDDILIETYRQGFLGNPIGGQPHLTEQPDVITPVKLGAVLMPNGEVICMGKTVAKYTDVFEYLTLK